MQPEPDYHPTLTIQSGMRISAIQHAFNAGFPFLKLEFFRHSHKPKAGNPREDQLPPESLLEGVVMDHGHKIEITESMTVTLLEQLFQDYFGLSVQVFRKSGKSWLETTLTDDWTLKKQNDEGLELSRYTP